MIRSTHWLIPATLLAVSHIALAADLPGYNAYYAAAPSRSLAPVASVATAPGLVTSVDRQRGVPTFLWAARDMGARRSAQAADATTAARAHLGRYARQLGLTPATVSAAAPALVHDLGRGPVVVVFRQDIAGVEVFRSRIKVLMDRSLDVVAIAGNLRDEVGVPKSFRGFRVAEPAALAAAFRDLYGADPGAGAFRRLAETKAGYRYYALRAAASSASGPVRLTEPARIRRVWFPLPDRLLPAYYLEVMAGSPAATTSDAYAYVIAADDARLLYRKNLTHKDTVSYRVWADASGDLRPKDGPLLDYTPHPSGTPDDSSPDFGLPSLVSVDGLNQFHDPWLPAGGQATTGNNVDAYTDDDSPDGFSLGDTRAVMTGPGTFDRVYDPLQGPQSSLDQRMAAVTQIFYTTNWLHDWWYDSGFDEAAGNAQKDNFGRGGVAGDPLRAEAQDGAPDQRNNADMSVGADGSSPRMQMFVWDGKSDVSLTLQPSNQSLKVGLPGFGPGAYDVTAPVILANDGSAPNADVCQPIINDVSGKIVLVDRGTCTFKSKAVAAQSAGAVGVILANNVPGDPPPQMGDGNPPTPVTIPILSITNEDGSALKTALASGAVTASLFRQASPDRDGTIDNTVVAHEWGHYAHLRQVACGSPMCSAESEGWGDFFALHMVVREGDDLRGTFGLSQYATGGSSDNPAYFGIRRYPYSTDLTRNPLTFRHITSGEALPAGVPVAAGPSMNDNAEPHAAGEVWASMLFEAYVALLERTQGPSPAYDFEEARRRMGDYVEAGLKLAPADPSFTEQRDAILAAAAASDLSDLQALAEAFARRGAGTCAVSPPRDSDTLSGVVEDFTVQPNLSILSIDLDDSVLSCDADGHLDGLETGLLTVKVLNGGTVPLQNASAQLTSTTPGVAFPNGSTIQFGDIAPHATSVATARVALGATPNVGHADLKVTLDAPACQGKAAIDVSPLVNYDEVPESAAIDTVEPTDTTWGTTGNAGVHVWSRTQPVPGNHAWSGIDFPSPSDTALASPVLQVGDTDDFVISFDHRYLFESSDGVQWDGAVVEVSITGGATWVDVSQYGDPGYTGTIGDPQGLAQNVLRNRQGYVGKSAAFPAMERVTINLGQALAGRPVRVRFRIGTDDAKGDFGWELDNIEFRGITNTPFTAIVDDETTCPNEPAWDAGPGDDAQAAGDGGLDAGTNPSPDGALPQEAGAGAAAAGDDYQVGGGCGCRSTTGDAGSGAAAIMMLAGAILVRRRSRRTGV